MARKHLQSLLNQFWVSNPKHKFAGFTLIELLISMVIGSIAISFTLALVIQLLQTDQQESVRNETQSEMQMALDYINQDLREATYVYDGNCIQGRADDTNTTGINEYCPGIVNHIRVPDNSAPILAFWKLEPLPEECQTPANQTICQPFQLVGRTPTLVVYFLRRNQLNEASTWRGQARITRYELDQFSGTDTLSPTTGYFSPIDTRTSYRTWPRQNNNGTWTNLQAGLPSLTGSNPALVDFVDAGISGSDPPACDAQYTASPHTSSNAQIANVKSFYACVRNTANQESGVYQDVFVFLKGNSYGKRGNQSSNFFPTLQTQVLSRGVVGKKPQAPE